MGFEGNGDVIWSPVIHVPSMVKMGLDPARIRNGGGFSDTQQAFLAYHRRNVLLKTRYHSQGFSRPTRNAGRLGMFPGCWPVKSDGRLVSLAG